MSFGKILGSIFIVIGSALGAGMLALPMVSADLGFLPTIILIVLLWSVMLIASFLILEVNLAFKPYRNHFSTMAKGTLGPVGQVVAWLTFLSIMYAITAAYISGSTSLLSVLLVNIFHINSPIWLNSILFTLIFGSIVYYSTAAVDYFVRFLMSVKGILLIMMLVLLMPNIKVAQLFYTNVTIKPLLSAIPFFLASLSYQFIIPSLVNYIGPKIKTLKIIAIIGSITPVIVYAFWLSGSLGVVPVVGQDSFATVKEAHNSVGVFVGVLNAHVHARWIKIAINGFADVAMTTSFLGVSLALFDFLADSCKRKNTRGGRLQTALLAFIVPLVFALFYPQGFVFALLFVALFLAILQLVLPALMVYRLRRSKTLSSPYRLFGGNFLLSLVLIVGIIVVVISLIDIIARI